jgi:VanZ family protein
MPVAPTGFSTSKAWRLLNATLPPIIWAGVIYSFSSQQVLPGFEFSLLDFLFKKCAHMFVYAVLFFLVSRGIAVLTSKTWNHQHWYAALLVCLLYAVSDEVHQGIVGGSRTPSLRDVGYDMLGAGFIWLKKYQYI